MRQVKSALTFPVINGSILVLLSISMILPILHLLAVSLSSPYYANAKLVYLWPKGFSFDVYRQIVRMETIWDAMGISVFITVVGTLVTLILCTSLSYALSRPMLPGRKILLQLIMITFVFPAPLIPLYLLVNELSLINTVWSLILPGALSAFYVIIMKTFFQGISSEIYDAAKIDGNSELGNYIRIVLPLSVPVIATISLFHAVAQWNSYFSALIYIRSKTLYPLPVLLRNLVVEGEMGMSSQSDLPVSMQLTPEMMKAGIIIFATLPILIVYPFLQKYFVKGAMLGSLKE